MFDPQEEPRLFGLAPGVDFPAALVAGLRERLAGQDPLAMAQVDLIVNTRRMERRLRTLFAEGQQGFLPRIHLLTDLHRLAPEIALRITDRAVQMHGAAGISQDTPLARQWTHLRTLRLVDGPDAVHRRQVARAELKPYRGNAPQSGQNTS